MSAKIGYTGHTYDSESGLTYAQARFYDPAIGRFLSVDSVGFMGEPSTFNRFAYGTGNPYLYVDPDGRQAVNFQSYRQAAITAAFQEQAQRVEAARLGELITEITSLENRQMFATSAQFALSLSVAAVFTAEFPPVALGLYVSSNTIGGAAALDKSINGSGINTLDTISLALGFVALPASGFAKIGLNDGADDFLAGSLGKLSGALTGGMILNPNNKDATPGNQTSNVDSSRRQRSTGNNTFSNS